MFRFQLFLILLILINLTNGQNETCRPLSQNRQGFRLILRYPPGWCVAMPHDECDGSANWVIQGFWPTSLITHSNEPHERNLLQYCCNQQNVKSLEQISDSLMKYWPPESYTDPFDYWQKQWDKYGACSHDPTSLNDERYEQMDVIEYFTIALDLFQRIPIQKWLENDQIFPTNDNSIETAKIRKTLNKHFNQLEQYNSFVYDLRCSHYNSTKDNKSRKVLNEIRICFDDQLNFIDCTKFSNTNILHSGRTGHCDYNYIYYVDKYGWP